MKIKELVSIIASIEGKRVEVPVGNIREIVSILSDMVYKDNEVYLLLLNNGKKRSKKK